MKPTLTDRYRNVAGKFDGNIFMHPSIPDKKLKNALKSYSRGLVQPEDIVILVDDTVFGSAKDGLIITEEFICGHTAFGDAFLINFSEITEISHNKGTLLVNGKEICRLDLPGKAVCNALFATLEEHLASKEKADTVKEGAPAQTLEDFIGSLPQEITLGLKSSQVSLYENLNRNFFARLCDYRRVIDEELSTLADSIAKEDGHASLRSLLLYLPMLYLKSALIKGKWSIAEGIAREWIMFKLILFSYSYFAGYTLINFKGEERDKIYDVIFDVHDALFDPFCQYLDGNPPCENFDSESVKKYISAVANIFTGERFRNFGEEACCNYICDYTLRNEFGKENTFDPATDKKLLAAYFEALDICTILVAEKIRQGL